MLPHIKEHPITNRVISIMKFVVPCIFICIYRQFYFYYMVVFVTVQFFGPITALLLFLIPELRSANETKDISFYK